MFSIIFYVSFLSTVLLFATVYTNTNIFVFGADKPLLVPKPDGILTPIPLEESSEGEAVAQDNVIVIAPTGGCKTGIPGPNNCSPCDPGLPEPEGVNRCMDTFEIRDYCEWITGLPSEHSDLGWCKGFGFERDVSFPESGSTVVNPVKDQSGNIEERTSENSDTNTKKPSLLIKDITPQSKNPNKNSTKYIETITQNLEEMGKVPSDTTETMMAAIDGDISALNRLCNILEQQCDEIDISTTTGSGSEDTGLAVLHLPYNVFTQISKWLEDYIWNNVCPAVWNRVDSGGTPPTDWEIEHCGPFPETDEDVE